MSGPADHEFLMQGIDRVFLVHKSNFHVANLRRQTILEVDMPSDVKDWYKTLRLQYPDAIFTFNSRVDLTQVLADSQEIPGYMKSILT